MPVDPIRQRLFLMVLALPRLVSAEKSADLLHSYQAESVRPDPAVVQSDNSHTPG